MDTVQRLPSEHIPRKSYNFLSNIRNMLQGSNRTNEITDNNLKSRALSEKRQKESDAPYNMNNQSYNLETMGKSLDFQHG